MDRFSERKIILVKRKTRLEELVVRFNSAAQAKFYVEHLGADFSDYQQEHDEYLQALKKAGDILEKFGRTHILERSYLQNFLFNPTDVVVAVGQDGMVANTLKYLYGQPLIGVNPSPGRWDGVLLPFLVRDLQTVIPEALQNGRKYKEVTIAAVLLNDGQTLFAVNDFFIGQKTHLSARYELTVGELSEKQSSSGIIVSTGLGSTGWLKSILEGAAGMAAKLTGNTLTMKTRDPFAWDSDHLYFSVREPFPSKTSGTNLVFGKITNAEPLKIVSHMPENGVIFSDGIESDFLEFNSGMGATVTLAEKKGLLVV